MPRTGRRSAILGAMDAAAFSESLSSVLDGAAITDLRRLSGGASRETWWFLADGRPTIVQRQRAGDQRDMMIEADVVRAARRGRRAGAGTARRRASDRRGRVHGARGDRGGDDRPQDPARRRLRRPPASTWSPTWVGRWRGFTRSIRRRCRNWSRSIRWRSTPTRSINLGQPHPVLELVRNWLDRPSADRRRRAAVVHGDFRLGNLIVGPDGLNAVIDWELAHIGDPMEDLGWLCVKAWRFGRARRSPGSGSTTNWSPPTKRRPGVDDRPGSRALVGGARHLEVGDHVHHPGQRPTSSGASRSHELAAIGRRVCENEYDLLLALEGKW